MLKLHIDNIDRSIVDDIVNMSSLAIPSKAYYPGFDNWVQDTFLPGLKVGTRDLLSVKDKRYGTLLGFTMLKVGIENKICNLSPLIDGVGLTQALLDSAEMYFLKDYTIDVPLNDNTVKLHSKLKHLGFHTLTSNLSSDGSAQITYIKPKNIGWV